MHLTVELGRVLVHADDLRDIDVIAAATIVACPVQDAASEPFSEATQSKQYKLSWEQRSQERVCWTRGHR